jgi:hypothetical protein
MSRRSGGAFQSAKTGDALINQIKRPIWILSEEIRLPHETRIFTEKLLGKADCFR